MNNESVDLKRFLSVFKEIGGVTILELKNMKLDWPNENPTVQVIYGDTQTNDA